MQVPGRGAVKRSTVVRTPSHSRAPAQPPAATRRAHRDPDDPSAHYGAPLMPSAPMPTTKSVGQGGRRKEVKSKVDSGLRVGAGSVGGGARRSRGVTRS